MAKQIRIQPSYNRDAVIIPKGIGRKALFALLKSLVGQEIAGVYQEIVK